MYKIPGVQRGISIMSSTHFLPVIIHPLAKRK